MTSLQTRRFASRRALDAALVERLAAALGGGSRPGPRAVMLAGGNSPLPAYHELARRGVRAAPGTRLLYSDERYVPEGDEASNRQRARVLVDALALPAGAELRVRTELPLPQAADDYERQLRALLDSGIPIGLGILGLGSDGHTASLFTAEDLARSAGRLAIAVDRPDGLQAVSVTPELLAQLREPLIVVTGGGKYDAIRALLAGDPALVAVQALAGCARAELWLEQSAEWSVYA